MQRDNDTADSGKPRVVLYCVKRSMSKYEWKKSMSES